MAKTRQRGAASGDDQGGSKLFSLGTLLKLPATVSTVRSFFDAVNWRAAEEVVQAEIRRKVAILGLPNTGKSTLFNTLQGHYRSAVSAEPGTTRSPMQALFGPFMMVDTPGHLPDIQESAAHDAAVILFLLDGTRAAGRADRDLYQRILTLKRPTIVALNKCDAAGSDPEGVAATQAAQIGAPEAIPISGKLGTNVAEDLIPALIAASPEAALAIGRELPKFRRPAAERLIRNASLISLAAGMEPIPLVDIPILLGNQVRLVLRIAAIYGEPVSSQYIRELLMTVAGSLVLRYLAGEAAKAVPFGGDLVSGAIAAAGTFAIGWVALEYFEGDKQMSSGQLRDLFNRLFQSIRADQQAQIDPARS